MNRSNNSVHTESWLSGRRTTLTERRQSCEWSAADGVANDDTPQHQTWTEDEPWQRSLSSRAGRFPKTLFALSRCRIPKAKGSGDLLSRSPVHAGTRDGASYEGSPGARRGKNPNSIRSCFGGGRSVKYIEEPTTSRHDRISKN